MHPFASMFLCAGAILLMVKGRDFKFKIVPCYLCGQRGEHSVGCPGRR